VIDDFLAANRDFAAERPHRQLLPHIDGTDGFFIAVLRRDGYPSLRL